MASNWLVPMTQQEVEDQAAAYTSAQIDPLLAAIAAQQKRGSRAIRRYSNQAARRIAPLTKQTRRDYRAAAGQEAAISDMLGRILEGGSGAGSLADALHGVSGQGGRAAGARAFAQGAGGAVAGMGSSALEQLVSTGASQTAAQRQQPGLIRLEGAQGVGQLNQAAMTEGQQIRASAPGIYQDVLQHLRDEQIGIAQSNRADRRDQQAAKGGSRGLTPGEVQSARESAYGAAVQMAANLFSYEVTTTSKTGREVTTTKQTPYPEALRRVIALISPTLQGIASPAEIQAFARQALAAGGYTQTAGGGFKGGQLNLPLGLGSLTVPGFGANVGSGQLAR